MIYSKLLGHTSCAVGRNLKNFKFSHCNIKSYVLNSTTKVASCGSFIYISNCQYSTILSSKLSQKSKPVVKSILPLAFPAYLSTNTNNVYQIIITNPVEGTSTTLNSSLDSTLNDIQSAEELITPTSDVATSLVDELSSVADVIEPSLSSLGLASGWTPVGWVQMFLEYLHVQQHWPWWTCIVTCTVVARILLIPLLLKTQKNAINMSNYMPQLQFLQGKFNEARRNGNQLEAARYAHEMMSYMKEKNISPLKNAMFPLLQAPIFLSFFFALRSMAKAPIESMKDGGIWWATDLTIPDPFYIMPVIACSTMYIIIKVGAESGMKLENFKLAKYVIGALPLIVFPFCMNFPAAILYYWVPNNICSLTLVSLLKIKSVREFCKMPVQQPLDPKFVLPKKGFVKGIKDAFEDQKVLAAVEDRRRMDSIRFQKAGTGPIPRTYSYDPTKPRPSNVATAASKSIAAKERKE